MIGFLILLYLLFIILSGIVAYNKHRSVIGWVVLSLFFSWFSFFILLFLKDKNPQKN